MKKYIALIISLLYIGIAGAQTTLSVTMNNASTSTYAITESGGVYFENDTLIVVENNRAEGYTALPIANIRKLTFGGSNSIVAAQASAVVTLYPNPTSDKFTIFGLSEGEHPMTLYSMAGTIVMQGICANGKEIDVSGIHKGVYVVKVANTACKLIKL